MTVKPPGQVAYEAAVRLMLDGDTEAGRVPDDGPDFAWDAIGNLERRSWEAAAQAAVDVFLSGDSVSAESIREALAAAEREPQPAPGIALRSDAETAAMLRADLDDAESLLAKWPKCPAGCNCRVGIEDDPDRNECGCDGPCNGGTAPQQPAPELAAAMAETRKMRDVVCKLLDLYGAPDDRLMQHSSVTRATLQRYAAEAGVHLDRLPK